MWDGAAHLRGDLESVRTKLKLQRGAGVLAPDSKNSQGAKTGALTTLLMRLHSGLTGQTTAKRTM